MNTSAGGHRPDQGVRGVPVRRPPVPRPRRRLDDRLRPHARRRTHSRRLSEREASELLERDLAHVRAARSSALPDARMPSTSTSSPRSSRSSTTSVPARSGPDTGIGPRAPGACLWQRAADEMLRWNRAGGRVLAGLTRRRQARARAVPAVPRRTIPSRAHRRASGSWCEEYDQPARGQATPAATRVAQRRRALLRARWAAAQGDLAAAQAVTAAGVVRAAALATAPCGLARS